MLKKLDIKQPTEEEQKEFMLEMGKAAFLKEPEQKIELHIHEKKGTTEYYEAPKKKKETGMAAGFIFVVFALFSTIIAFATGKYVALIGAALQLFGGITLLVVNKE